MMISEEAYILTVYGIGWVGGKGRGKEGCSSEHSNTHTARRLSSYYSIEDPDQPIPK